MIRTLAAKVIDGFHSQGWTPIGRGGTWAGAMRPLEQYIQRRVERAVKAEREACASICDRFQARDVGMQPAECAAAIRARGAK